MSTNLDLLSHKVVEGLKNTVQLLLSYYQPEPSELLLRYYFDHVLFILPLVNGVLFPSCLSSSYVPLLLTARPGKQRDVIRNEGT